MNAVEPANDMVPLVVRRDVADAINARVASGEYSNQDEVIRNGLRLLIEEDSLTHDPEVERWLHEVAVPIAEETLRDPSRSIPADNVRAHFAARRATRA